MHYGHIVYNYYNNVLYSFISLLLSYLLPSTQPYTTVHNPQTQPNTQPKTLLVNDLTPSTQPTQPIQHLSQEITEVV